MKTTSAADAKARFAEYVREAEEGEPVVITRHGKPVVALVAAGDLEQLDRLRSAGPEAGLASVAGGWQDSEELVRALGNVRRRGSRRGPRFDR